MITGFDGKVAIVTGTASGIGRGSAIALAAAGAAVVVADVSDAGNETVAEIAGRGGESVFVRADMRSTTDVQEMVDTAVRRYGRLDVAHNNAGVDIPHGPLTEVDESDWDRILDHAGGLYLFPDATFIVGAGEMGYAYRPPDGIRSAFLIDDLSPTRNFRWIDRPRLRPLRRRQHPHTL